MKHILFAVLVLALLLGATVAQAEVIAWDKSSVELTGVCLPNGDAQFTATNTGRGMDGPTAWREYEADTLTQQGAVILAAGGSYVWTFASKGVPVRFEIDQRPGHPGSSHPTLTLTCNIPSAVGLRTFTATSAGNRGGCAPANQWRGLACTITDYRPGYVSGKCDGGLWFKDVRTARVWRQDTPVTVQGCEYEGWQLDSAPGFPLRISK